MIRIDRAGQASKRYAGASAAPLVEADGRCPLWRLHAAFERPGRIERDLVELEDGSRWFTVARTVHPQGRRAGDIAAEFVIGIGLDARLAGMLALARGLDLLGPATPVGLGCMACTRPECPQRAAPPKGRALLFNERERGVSPFSFAGD
jgi:predicted transcriptional regulator